MGAFWAGFQAVNTALETAGLDVITDPSEFTAPGVIVEAPSMTAATMGAWTLSVPVVVIGEAPATRDTLRFLMDTSETILNVLDETTTNPSTYLHAGQTFPAYRITATVTITREGTP